MSSWKKDPEEECMLDSKDITCPSYIACRRCGFHKPEAKRRKELRAAEGMTKGSDGLHRLVIKREEDE